MEADTIDIRKMLAAGHSEQVAAAIRKLPETSVDEQLDLVRRFVFQPHLKDVLVSVLQRFRRYPILYWEYLTPDGEVKLVKANNHPRTSKVWLEYLERALVTEGTLLYSSTLKDEVSLQSYIMASKSKAKPRRKTNIMEAFD